MNLYIMTRGRVGKQITYDSIPWSWRDRTYIVCPLEEAGLHDVRNTMPVGPDIKNYSDKFKFIVEDRMGDGEEKAVILDDDLVFSRQVPKNGKISLKTIAGQETERLITLFGFMEVLLEDTALVGVHPRQMGHLQSPPFVENGKVVCIQGINRRLVGRVPDLNRFPILADVILNASLLERGQGNKIITTFFQNWGSCQAPGGCSLTRTPEMQAEACYWLEERFGPYIKAVVKKPKNKWLGEERVDFRGQWKALFSAGSAGLLHNKAGGNTEEKGSGGAKTVE